MSSGTRAYRAASLVTALTGAAILVAAALGGPSATNAPFAYTSAYTFFAVGALNYLSDSRSRWTHIMLLSANFSGVVVSAIAAAALRTTTGYCAAVLVVVVALFAVAVGMKDP